jgi:magnesium-transporting ATPase (P-type)
MSNGNSVELIQAEVESMAEQGLRTLVFAYKEFKEEIEDIEGLKAENLENDL